MFSVRIKMRFFIKVFCFLILNYEHVITDELFVEYTYTFDAIPLGHSGVLITWKPNITTESEVDLGNTRSTFYFSIHIVGDENTVNSSLNSSDRCPSSYEQYKIGHALKDNTLYEVLIKQSDSKKNFKNETYSVKVRTSFKSETKPAKPYFKFFADIYNSPVTEVRWFPCGRKRICHDQQSGTHFGISIKEVDNMGMRKLIQVKREEILQDIINVVFWPGVKYEVVVYSVNGEYTTDSDPQEIYLKPEISTVQYVNVISLPDSSVLISWKPPKQSVGTLRNLLYSYFTTFLNSSEHEEYDPFLGSDSVNLHMGKIRGGSFDQRRIFGLLPEIIYTYIIIPYNDNGIGFEYRMKHKLQVYDSDLPIAKPDFNYEYRFLSSKPSQICSVEFQWLPCGKSLDCNNTRPGSEYSFKVKPEPIEKPFYYNDYGYHIYYFDTDLLYNVTIISSIGSYFSEPATKIFKNCSEVKENIPLVI